MELISERFIQHLPGICSQEFHPNLGPLLILAVFNVSPLLSEFPYLCPVCPIDLLSFTAPCSERGCAKLVQAALQSRSPCLRSQFQH